MSIQNQMQVRRIKYSQETGWSCLVEYFFNSIKSLEDGSFIAVLKINNLHIRSKVLINGDDYFIIGKSLLDVLPKNSVISISVESIDFPGIALFEDIALLVGNVEVNATDATSTLLERFSNGFFVDHWGNLCQSFGTGDDRKRKHAELFTKLDSVLSPVFGEIAYVIGGNLLGLIREGAFLDHDDDIDVAIFLGSIGSELVNKKFFEIHDFLSTQFPKEAGYDFKMYGPCHIGIYSQSEDSYMDVFAAWIDPELDYYRFSGVGGYWGSNEFCFSLIDYLGVSLRIPKNFELELDITYGCGKWRVPDKNFVWKSPDKAQSMKDRISTLGWDDFRVRYPLIK